MNTEKQIEFNKVKEIWAGFGITEYAKDKIRDKEIILDETALRKELKDTTNSRNMIEKLGIPPLQDMTEINEILTVAGRGDCLSQYQLERVENVTVVAERLKDYLSRGRQYDNPLAYYDENLDGLSELRDEINRQIRNEAVDDRASYGRQDSGP
jgi:dsDNA-specific endonuclease/ATPase MutS2